MARMAAAAEVSVKGFGDRVYRLLEQVDYRRADSSDEREAIYRLRYDAYLREGTIPSNIAKRVTDSYDDMENAYTVGVHIDGRLASSFRLHVSTPQFSDIPAAHVFPDILNPLIEAGKVIIDPTRFVADAASARQYPELPYATVRVAALATEYFAADYVLATVRAEHQAFYRRVFGCKPVCPPRPYPGLIKPISLMLVDHRQERETIARRYPFFRSTFFERRMLFERAVTAKVARRSAA
jgi:N-acyl-L-homoserine lactone synthetase